MYICRGRKQKIIPFPNILHRPKAFQVIKNDEAIKKGAPIIDNPQTNPVSYSANSLDIIFRKVPLLSDLNSVTDIFKS